MTIEQRVLMLEASVKSLRRTVADLHLALADQTRATLDATTATTNLNAAAMEAADVGREMLSTMQRHTRHARSIEALFLEAIRRLSAGERVDDLHDDLRRFLEERDEGE